MSGGEWLRNFAPAMEEAARRQRKVPRKRAAIRAAKARQRAREALITAQIEGWVVADRGGFISRTLKEPHTELSRGARIVEVLRVKVLEGLGTAEGLFTEENPFREVVYWYEKDGTLIARRDGWEERATSGEHFVEVGPGMAARGGRRR